MRESFYRELHRPPPEPGVESDRVAAFLQQHGEDEFATALQQALDLAELGQHLSYLGLLRQQRETADHGAKILEQAADRIERQMAATACPPRLKLPCWPGPEGRPGTGAGAGKLRMEWIATTLDLAGTKTEPARRFLAEAMAARDAEAARGENMRLLHRFGAKHTPLPGALRELSDDEFRLRRRGSVRRLAHTLAGLDPQRAQSACEGIAGRQQTLLTAAYRLRELETPSPADGNNPGDIERHAEAMLEEIRRRPALSNGSRGHLWLSQELARRGRVCLRTAAESAAELRENPEQATDRTRFEPGTPNHATWHWRNGLLLTAAARQPEPEPLTAGEWREMREMTPE